MEIKKIKQILFCCLVIMLFSCNKKKSANEFIAFKNIDRQIILDSCKGLNMPIKFNPDHYQLYLMNPKDSSLICDIQKLFYFKEYYSKYILVFYSMVDNKNYLAVLQNNLINYYPCYYLIGFKIKQNNNVFQIEVKDSLIEFGTLGYGIHQLKLLKNDTVPKYQYKDFGPHKL